MAAKSKNHIVFQTERRERVLCKMIRIILKSAIFINNRISIYLYPYHRVSLSFMIVFGSTTFSFFTMNPYNFIRYLKCLSKSE